MTLIGSNVAAIFKALSPNAPVAPTIIINNNATNVNSTAPRHNGSNVIPKSLSRERARRLKQMRAKEEKRAKAAQKDTEAECRPGTDPVHE